MVKSNKVFFFSIFILGCSLTFAALSNIALFADGANWFFEFLRSGRLYHDYSFKRYSDLIVQLPSFVLLKVYGTEASIAFYRVLWNLSYLLHPILSVLICYAILKNEKNTTLKYFPLIGALTCTLPAIAFSVGVAPTTISISWIAWAILVGQKNWKLKRPFFLLLILLMLFSYETCFLLLFIFFILTWQKDLPQREKRFWSFFLITEALILIYLIFTHVGPQIDRFWHSLPFAFSFWKITAFLFVGFILVIPHIKFRSRWLHLIFVPVLVFALFKDEAIELWSSYNFRTLSVPLTGVLMIASIPYLKTEKYSNRHLVITSFYASVFSSLMLIFTANKWNNSLNEVERAITNNRGCVYKSYEGYGLSDLTISKHFFTPLTIVLQRSWRIDPVLLTPITEKDWEIGEPCKLVDGRVKISNMEFLFGESKTFTFPTINK